jgi:hypothetical protein
MGTTEEVQVSVLIPVKDEEATLGTLVGEIDAGDRVRGHLRRRRQH